MNIRRATQADLPAIETLLASDSATNRPRFAELIRAALETASTEYIASIAGNTSEIEAVAAYGMIAGTLGTGTIYGVTPVSSAVTELLAFAERELKQLGAQRIVAEFSDTEGFMPYRDALLDYGYDPAGIVDDFYRDGVALVIFVHG